MLTILGENQRYCDGVSRRNFLKIGTLGLGALTLTDLLAAEAQAGTTAGRLSHKAIIMVYLPGGPPQHETFDPKPDAPSDMRGEFKPLKTNVPGMEIGEVFPKLAQLADKYAVIRTLVGARDEHANPLCLTGYPLAEVRLNQPSLGAMVSKLWGPVEKTVPPFVDLIPVTQHKPYSIPAATGFLGRQYGPAKPDEQSMGDMTLSGISLQRMNDRRRLLASVDRYRRMVDESDMVRGADALTQQAFEILTSSRFVEALDVSREDPKTLALYGKGQDRPAGDGCPLKNEQFLAARRLVEAGVRCVTLGYGFWDFHGGNASNMRTYGPMLDQAVSGLIQDLHNRGLEKDVSVVVWGDFGRTPVINKDAGRDHWPSVQAGLVAGGGMRMGQVIGSTTKDGGYADDRPVHYREVLATLLHQMGFDVRERMVEGIDGRPHFLLQGSEPMPELI